MGRTGYVKADYCYLEDQMEQSGFAVDMLDVNGNQVSRPEIINLTDGLAYTACVFFEGEKLEFDYTYGCKFQYLYIVNGNGLAGGLENGRGRAHKLKLTFDQTTEFYIELPEEYAPMGYFVRIPEATASHVQIEMLDASGDSNIMELSEIKLCGTLCLRAEEHTGP